MWKAKLPLLRKMLLGWKFPMVCRELAFTSWVFRVVLGVIRFALGMQNEPEAEQTCPGPCRR